MKRRGLLLTLTEPPPGMEEEPQYLSFFEKPTPWTRRCLGKAVLFKRWACEQVDPGAADPHPAATALVLGKVVPGALQVRKFAASNGERIALCELSESAAQAASGLVYRLYQP